MPGEHIYGLMEKIKDLTNQLIEEGGFSIRKLQDCYQGKLAEDSVTIYSIWDDYIQEKRAEEAFGTASVVKTLEIVLLKTMVEESNSQTSILISYKVG